MTVFGAMPHDVHRCLVRLAEFGVARHARDGSGTYGAAWPARSAAVALLRAFLDEDDAVDAEARSAAAGRVRRQVARDEKMLVVLEWIRTAARSERPVLVIGPEGADARSVARMIHDLGRYADDTFRAIDCRERPASFDVAETLTHAGTLLLEYAHALAPEAQATVADALAARGREATGARLVSTTSKTLDELVRRGDLREDLSRALNGFAIRLPALAERPDDVPVIAERMLADHCREHGLDPDRYIWSAGALARLRAHPWPGDVRELEQTVARAATVAEGVIGEAHLGLRAAGVPGRAAGPLATLRDTERAHVARVLEAVGWNKKQAARVLDISRGTLYRKISDYGLRQPGVGE